MTMTIITQLPAHPVHTDPIDAAIAELLDASMEGRLICDGSCNGMASCAVAPLGDLASAA